MTGYQTNRKFSDKFLSEIKAILGLGFLTDKYEEEDWLRETDLTTLGLKPYRFAIRIRRFDIYQNPQWREQFTIRYALAHGGDTEFQKIMNGWGDYLFYGFSDEAEEHLKYWFIGSLNAFRKFIKRLYKQYGKDSTRKEKRLIINSDTYGSSFLYFEKSEIPNFVVADSLSCPFNIEIKKKGEELSQDIIF